MGTKMAPAYANCFMGKHVVHLPHTHIHRDSFFIIWTGAKYSHTINQIHQTIKFTYELSDTELKFLDHTRETDSEAKIY